MDRIADRRVFQRAALAVVIGIGAAVARPANAQSALGDVFVIDMENHNLTQPGSVTSPQPLLGNSAAPFLNSLLTPGNANAAMTSYATNYHNVAAGLHPSEPNYLWQTAGSSFGVTNDNDPYANNGANVQTTTSLTGLLQNAGVSWTAYDEDTDLAVNSGTVNAPGAGGLTSTVAPSSQWTVPTTSYNGTSSSYVNAYNGSDQYDYATKHDGTLFFTDSNGGTQTTANNSTSNPEASHYAPLQQLTTDLNNNTVSRYNLITPDELNDMHTALNTNFTYDGVTYTAGTDQESVAQGDNFLSILVPQIEASQAFKNNGAIVIWFDETEGGDTSDFTMPEIVISPLAKGNAYASSVDYTHSSDLKTLQDLFDVSPTQGDAYLGDAATPDTNDLSDMFVSGAIPPASGSAAAPEPGSLALLALAPIGLAGLRQRRK